MLPIHRRGLGDSAGRISEVVDQIRMEQWLVCFDRQQIVASMVQDGLGKADLMQRVRPPARAHSKRSADSRGNRRR
jgi:hypothetical protein